MGEGNLEAQTCSYKVSMFMGGEGVVYSMVTIVDV